MTVNDPIADMLTRVRNAVMSGQAMTAMPFSKVKVEIAKILKEEGFVSGYEVVDGKVAGSKVLRIRLSMLASAESANR